MHKPSRLFAGRRGYRTLDVWRLGMEAAESIYLATRSFPTEERFGLSAQLRRAAASIPSNIAEGNERRTRSDQLRFVIQARGSLAEIETQLALAYRLGFATEEALQPTVALLEQLGRALHRFLEAVSQLSQSEVTSSDALTQRRQSKRDP